MKKKPDLTKESSVEDKKFPLPIYEADEDIYRKEKEVSFREEAEENLHAKSAHDLDVPGADIDDDDEEIGEEDEENNYYSLGGDNHDDLEEKNDDLIDTDQ
jgi:hypothetical protein